MAASGGAAGVTLHLELRQRTGGTIVELALAGPAAAYLEKLPAARREAAAALVPALPPPTVETPWLVGRDLAPVLAAIPRDVFG